MHRFLLCQLAIALAACGPGPATPVDMGPPDILLAPRAPTDHPPLPLVTSLGGPVQPTPEVWTVVWQGSETLGAQVAAFHAWMLQSTYWTNTLAEYGVGAGTGKGLLVIQQPAPTSLDDGMLQQLITALIGGTVTTSPPFPVPNSNSQFAFLLPQGAMSFAGGLTGCHPGGYVGYHTEMPKVNNHATPGSYTVALQCDPAPGTYFDQLTQVLSHEAVEAATDPQPNSRPTYIDPASGNEIGDLCNDLGLPVPVAGTSTIYWVQRQYSTAAAKDGTHDPCVPAPNLPYFNVAIAPVHMTLTLGKTPPSTTSAQIEPFAFGNAGEIHWTFAGNIGPGISFYPTSGIAHAGDTFALILSADGTAKTGTYSMLIESQSQAGGTNLWFSTLTLK